MAPKEGALIFVENVCVKKPRSTKEQQEIFYFFRDQRPIRLKIFLLPEGFCENPTLDTPYSEPSARHFELCQGDKHRTNTVGNFLCKGSMIHHQLSETPGTSAGKYELFAVGD